jgi:hypothetical protein
MVLTRMIPCHTVKAINRAKIDTSACFELRTPASFRVYAMREPLSNIPLATFTTKVTGYGFHHPGLALAFFGYFLPPCHYPDISLQILIVYLNVDPHIPPIKKPPDTNIKGFL